MKEKNQIYLSGGGDEHQSFSLDKFFFNILPKNSKFLYLPNALRNHSLYKTAGLWMRSVLKLHKRLDLDFEMADDLSLYTIDDLKKFKSIYIGGGNTWDLMNEFEECGFPVILKEYLKSEGSVYGGSAGAIIMGKRLDTQNDENKILFKGVSGLNILNELSVACHFKEEDGLRFSLWSKDNKLPIICLSEKNGLILENSIAMCVGEECCVYFDKKGLKKVYKPGEKFKI